MRKNKLPVRFTGQHFTVDKVLILDAIRIAKLKENDIVLDIGAGKGFLTVHLARQRTRVIAIENDKILVGILQKKFAHIPNVKIISKDFLDVRISCSGFKVVSNIPYGITSSILKSLMFDHVANFKGGSLVMQLEPARKLFSEKVFTPYTLFYHTFFDLKLVYEIGPESFMPPPKVKSALLKIEKKEAPVHDVLKEKYLTFLSYLLQKPHLPVRTALKKIFRKNQVREISEKYGIDLNGLVVSLSAYQCTGCFLEMLEKVPESKQVSRH